MAARGPTLGLLGSGEFLPWAEEVDVALIEAAGSGTDRVLVAPTASSPEGQEVFDRWATMGLDHYRRIGAAPEVLPLRSSEDAARSEVVDRLDGAALVFFSGGNPAYLAGVLRGTPFLEWLLGSVEVGETSLGGCSAGASVLGVRVPDPRSRVMSADIWSDGLGFLPVMISAHWDTLDRWAPGIRKFVLDSVPDGLPHVAIEELTAAVGDGRSFRVMGTGDVLVHRSGRSDAHHGPGETFSLVEGPEEG
ncbi:MAG TPA: Type 1 glutamine amidotransferase-like domain-containing protein [Actinomycetota bacterium]|nr:Type 1 glutamine amidotransferase-like domain-containing protein [Actinomycetota bacterium]